MPRTQFSLKTMLWLMACAACFFGGRTIGIQDERQRLPAELVDEKRQLERLREKTEYLNGELNKRIAEWIKEVNALSASPNETHSPRQPEPSAHFSGSR